MNMKRRKRKGNEGFTLVEVIAVLILLGILIAIALPKYVDLQANAELRAVDAGIAELNGREALIWGNVKLSQSGWTSDPGLISDPQYSTNLGTDYSWVAPKGISQNGGTLRFGSANVDLTRAHSTSDSPANWTKD